jgi:protocatechuate 3,4-dioxygenase beta subunit
VIDSDGAPLPGAYVDVRGSADRARPFALISGYGRTDSAGHYKIEALAMNRPE